ncbi:hypothetical protein HRbin39_01306 [bacterium HR39]|nr:hypothetical protein HRbin39_01306 [bacterium HR39]
MMRPEDEGRAVRRMEILRPDGSTVRWERRRAAGVLRPYGPRHPAERRAARRPAGEPARGRELDLEV